MRLSNLLLPLTLLLLIQIGLVCSQSDIIGKWTNPTIRTNTNNFCCTPSSIKVEDAGFGRLIANYDYNVKSGDKCYMLFRTWNGDSISLYNSSTPGVYYGVPSTIPQITFYYEVSNTSGLNIISNSTNQYYTNPCDYAMSSKNALPLIPIGIGAFCFFLIGGLIAFKLYQKRQQNLINQQNLAGLNNSFVVPNAYTGYNNNYQGYPQYQPQSGYPQQRFN